MITIDLDMLNTSQLAKLYNALADYSEGTIYYFLRVPMLEAVLEAGIANAGLIDFWREIMRQY